MRTRRLVTALIAVLGLVATGLLSASSASAERRHGWQFIDIARFLGRDWPDTCAFPVQLTVPRQDTYQKVLVSPRGQVVLLLNGALRETWTNPANHKSITVNATGSGKATFNADGSLSIIQTGHLGITPLTSADAARFGFPALATLSGVLDEEYAANGNLTSIALKHGHFGTDICAALT
jgi:hypothetical protein